MMAYSDNRSTFSFTVLFPTVSSSHPHQPTLLILPSTSPHPHQPASSSHPHQPNPPHPPIHTSPYSIASRPPATPTLKTFHRVLRLATRLS
ncbi:hypothetical protein Pmani_011365 [Petrolisthes manimaculis]|uniref:Uncharacterized protein n=1 Tax=Petrolisthes manimaculis TaxID=1843537 RepID=A0AAE1Q0V6_9EUCA|nr:hypothetical protein Pmani_011365 [Petrolisthes manimaculis]